jgi:hypothetical protein
MATLATAARMAEVNRATAHLGTGSEHDDTAGRLTLSDFMSLAYVVSTMYKRVHPEKKVEERRRVHAYSEAPVLYALLFFILCASSLGLFVLCTPVVCRPIGTDTLSFTSSSGANSYYAMQYVNAVCDTEIKVSSVSGFTVLAVALIFVGLALVGVNVVGLAKLNRLHAIARGDVYTELLHGKPPEVWETPAAFVRFFAAFAVFKAAFTLACVGGFTYFAYMFAGKDRASRDASSGQLQGGSLLSRYGAVCDGRIIHFDDRFPGSFRCHLEREPVLQYLTALVYAAGGILLIVMTGMLGAMAGFWLDYATWRRELTATKAKGGAGEGAGPDPDAGLVRSVRSVIRLAMGYFIAEPSEGLPELMAKIVVGKPPGKEELAAVVGRAMHLNKPPPAEVTEVMYTIMQGAMGRGMGDPEDMKELIMAAVCAWGDAERQTYMRGMLDLLKQQKMAQRQTGAITPSPLGAQPGAAANGGAELFVDAHN